MILKRGYTPPPRVNLFKINLLVVIAGIIASQSYTIIIIINRMTNSKQHMMPTR